LPCVTMDRTVPTTILPGRFAATRSPGRNSRCGNSLAFARIPACHEFRSACITKALTVVPRTLCGLVDPVSFLPRASEEHRRSCTCGTCGVVAGQLAEVKGKLFIELHGFHDDVQDVCGYGSALEMRLLVERLGLFLRATKQDGIAITRCHAGFCNAAFQLAPCSQNRPNSLKNSAFTDATLSTFRRAVFLFVKGSCAQEAVFRPSFVSGTDVSIAARMVCVVWQKTKYLPANFAARSLIFSQAGPRPSTAPNQIASPSPKVPEKRSYSGTFMLIFHPW
jgi:hypothetical protein